MKKFWSTLKYLLFLSLGLGIFFWVYPFKELEETWAMLKKANYIYVVPVVILALSAHYSRGLRWKLLIEPNGYSTKGFSTFRSVMIGYYFNTIVPRMGEVSRCIALNKIDKVPVSLSLGTVVTERLFDLIALAIIVTTTILVEFDLVGEYILDLLEGKVEQTSGALSIKLLVVFSALLAISVVVSYLMRKTAIFAKVKDVLAGFKKGIISVFRLKNPWAFIVHTVFIWLAYYAMCYLSFKTLPGTSELGFSAGLVVFTLSTIGFIAPVPGGVGTYNYMFTLALSLYAVEEETGKAVAMIAFLGNTILNLVVGAIALFFSPKIAEEDASKHPGKTV